MRVLLTTLLVLTLTTASAAVMAQSNNGGDAPCEGPTIDASTFTIEPEIACVEFSSELIADDGEGNYGFWNHQITNSCAFPVSSTDGIFDGAQSVARDETATMILTGSMGGPMPDESGSNVYMLRIGLNTHTLTHNYDVATADSKTTWEDANCPEDEVDQEGDDGGDGDGGGGCSIVTSTSTPIMFALLLVVAGLRRRR